MAASLAWGGHRNGQIPQGALTGAVNYHPLPGEPVGPLAGMLRADAARQWFVMDAHYFATTGRHLTLSEGYRALSDQQGRWNTYQRRGSPLAAYPGTSLHGWAISADVGSEGRAWMTTNGPRFGWRPTGRSFSRPEPWHFDYLGGGDITKTPAELTSSNPASGGRPTPVLLPASNGDTMIQIRLRGTDLSGFIADVAPGYLHHSGSIPEADITRNVISNPDERHELDWADFQRVLLGHGIDRQFYGVPTDLRKLDLQPWGGLWSEERAIHQRLSTIETSLATIITATKK